MSEITLEERTYQTLADVVRTTVVNRKVVARPPFTFLHKILVETLGGFDLFSKQQLEYSTITTTQAKAAFLTRAIAFVTFAMEANDRRQHISCLLLVSPVQVLAGLSVPDTLRFLLQLCEVYQMPERDIKDAAAKKVQEKGDAYLYSSGVTFRKGLVLFQGVIRNYLNRVRKTATLNDVPEQSRGGRFIDDISLNEQENTCVLIYEKDVKKAKDKADEMKRSNATHNGLASRENANALFTDQLDLSKKKSSCARENAGCVLSSNSKSLLVALKTTKSHSMKRAQSQRQLATKVGMSGLLASKTFSSMNISKQKSCVLLGELKIKSENNQAECKSLLQDLKGSDWQSSLRKILAEGRDKALLLKAGVGDAGRSQTQTMQMNAFVPSLVGTMPLALGKKGRINQNDQRNDQTRSSQESHVTISNPSLTTRRSSLQRGVSPSNVQHSGKAPVNAEGVHSSSSVIIGSTGGMAESAFAGTYHMTEQRTPEQQTLIRDIVMRIDSYIKRKRLRVIDLFRFCDADGNGNISPKELIDTLSQMEIQLSSDQASTFLHYIDKDNNGCIDVDEFEMLVRVFRRSEAQREQVKRELRASRKGLMNKTCQKSNVAIKAKFKEAILDEFKAAQENGNDGMNADQLRSLISRISSPELNDTIIDSLVDRAAKLATSASKTLFSIGSQPQARTLNGNYRISHQHLAMAMGELKWTKHTNQYLDQAWIRQFDSQLERAIREYELL